MQSPPRIAPLNRQLNSTCNNRQLRVESWQEFEVEGLEAELRSSRDRTESRSVRFACQSESTQSDSQSPRDA